MDYLDFGITIDKSQILASCGGLQVMSNFQINQDIEAAMEFLQSEDNDEINNIITYQWKQNVGQILFKSLFTSEISKLYEKAVKLAKDKNKGIRFRISVQPPDIANYPWEIMCDTNKNYLSTNEKLSVTRFVPGDTIEAKKYRAPLKMLIIGSNPSIPNVPGVKVDREIKAIKESLKSESDNGLISIEESTGNITDILNLFQKNKYNIIHFIGHGIFENDIGYLAFEDGRGDLFKADEQRVKDLFGNQSESCGLVILNACQGAMSSTSRTFTGLAPALLIKGFPCVLAMRYSISNDMTIFFSKEFYKNISCLSIDENLQRIREKILVSPNSDPRDFPSPVLFMNSEGLILMKANEFAIEPAFANQFLDGYYDVISDAGVVHHLMEFTRLHFGSGNPDFEAIRLQFLAQAPKVGLIHYKLKSLQVLNGLSTNEILKSKVNSLENLLKEFKDTYAMDDTSKDELIRKAAKIHKSHDELQNELKILYREIINGSISK